MDLLGDLGFVFVCTDNVLIIQQEGEIEQDHLSEVEVVLGRLQDKGSWANLRKSFFMQTEVEHLGFPLTKDRIRPQPQKVEATLRMEPPKDRKQLKVFLGMIDFHRDVWP